MQTKGTIIFWKMVHKHKGRTNRFIFFIDQNTSFRFVTLVLFIRIKLSKDSKRNVNHFFELPS